MSQQPDQASQTYDAENIQVLEGLTAVRKRPAMYIGSVGRSGLHHLVKEIVDNAVDEALAGFCKNIKVEILKDQIIRVTDDGRGIPVKVHPKYGMPTLEVIMTKLHSGGKFDSNSYKISGGLHGVGLGVVNALSVFIELTIRRNGKVYWQRYEQGIKAYEFKELGDIKPDDPYKTGTIVTFKPDEEIFTETTEFDFETLSTRMRETAFLTKGLNIEIIDYRGEETKKDSYHYEGGIKSWVHEINEASGRELLTPEPIYLEGEKEQVLVEVALGYNEGFNRQNQFSFANNINTREGGTHLTGFRQGLTNVIKAYQKRMDESKIRTSKKSNGKKTTKEEVIIEGDDVREGLVAVVSVKLHDPQFEGQTKAKLGSNNVRGVVYSVVYDGLNEFFEHNPKIAEQVVNKAYFAAEVRVKTKKVRDQARKKGIKPENIVPCRSTDAEETEIFIVEGRSAGGSAKSGRDPKRQAVLMLRGKVINVEKNSMIKVLDNREIQSMITVLGTDIDDHFDLTKLKYHKVIIMTDADVDGSHIRTLLLTFFYRHMRSLVEEVHLYNAQPPLFSINKKNKKIYFYTDDEMKKWREQNPNEKGNQQRYKGLGEMNAQELSETTMDIEQRHLWQVTVEQMVEAGRLMSILMGYNVEIRRDYILEHSKDKSIEIDV